MMVTMSEPLPEGHPDRWLRPGAEIGPGSVTLELGGVSEIKNEFGVSRNTVSMWAARRLTNGFPEPVLTLAMGPVYDMDKVRAWRIGKLAETAS